MRLKLISKIMFIAVILAGMLSCDNDYEEVFPEESLEQNKIPVSIDKLENDLGFKQTNISKASSDSISIRKWNTIQNGESFFYQIGNVIYEEIYRDFSGNSFIEYDLTNFLDENFTICLDKSRNLYIALPTHNPGNTSLAYMWNNNTRKWDSWRSFIYEEPTSSCQTILTSINIAGSTPTVCPLSGYDISLSRDTADQYQWGILDNANIIFTNDSGQGVYVPDDRIYSTNQHYLSMMVGNASGTYNFFGDAIVPPSTRILIAVRGKKNNCQEWSNWIFRTIQTSSNGCR